MIKAVLKDKENKTLILLGLSNENIRLLYEKRPLYIKLDELGIVEVLEDKLKDMRIVIIVGDTKESILEDIRQATGIDKLAINHSN